MIVDADCHISPLKEGSNITVEELLRRMDRSVVDKAPVWRDALPGVLTEAGTIRLKGGSVGIQARTPTRSDKTAGVEGRTERLPCCHLPVRRRRVEEETTGRT